MKHVSADFVRAAYVERDRQVELGWTVQHDACHGGIKHLVEQALDRVEDSPRAVIAAFLLAIRDQVDLEAGR